MALPETCNKSIADVATGIWRLRRRLGRLEAAAPSPELRGMIRDMDALWDALSQAGVEVLDHAGAAYDPGLAVKVAAFQPTPALDRERIIETIRPTVYLKDEWIQMSEVIVGTPEGTGGEQLGENGHDTGNH